MRVEQIGDATLYLGDCLEIMPTLPDGSIDMTWADPTYGHKNHDGDLNAQLNKHRGIENQPIQNDDPESMRAVVDGMLIEAVRVLSPDCCCCCCCGGGGPRPTFAWLAERMDTRGLAFFHSVIWDKRNPGLGWRYRRQHEMLMIAHREGGRLLWRDNDVAVRNIISMMPPKKRNHPNEKPLGYPAHFIGLHSSPGHTILDPFMGSGTTGVACMNLGRKFIGIEIEPKYFEIACKRIDQAQRQGQLFTPEKPKVTQLEI